MALTKICNVDEITVTENGVILYREVTKILEDNEEISKSFHRTAVVPGQDLSNAPAQVVSICNVVWTQDVIEKFKQQQVVKQPLKP